MHEENSTRVVRGWRDTLAIGFASVFFLGYAPVASGTAGSLPGIVLALLLNHRPVALLVLTVILFALGVAVSTRVETTLGRKDPSEITIDELVGMLVAFLWLPMGWSSVFSVFILYRAFDILKPFPARRCEGLGGGLGIMADDVIAGVYANLVFRLVMLVL